MCGCTIKEVETFLTLQKKTEQCIFLKAKRSKLLDRMHQTQAELDCVDYLIFQMENDK